MQVTAASTPPDPYLSSLGIIPTVILHEISFILYQENMQAVLRNFYKFCTVEIYLQVTFKTIFLWLCDMYTISFTVVLAGELRLHKGTVKLAYYT